MILNNNNSSNSLAITVYNSNNFSIVPFEANNDFDSILFNQVSIDHDLDFLEITKFLENSS